MDPMLGIWKLLSGMFKSDMISLACHMNIFDIVDSLAEEKNDGWTSYETIATNHDFNVEKLQLFLKSFVAVGLLHRKGHCYRNTEMSRLYLKTSSEECVANSVIHYTSYAAEKNERFVNILQDKVDISAEFMSASDKVVNFQHDFMALFAPDDPTFNILFQNVDTTNFKTAIDLGGGFGFKTRKIKKYFPNTTMTIVDLPDVVQAAQQPENNKELENINFESGDFFEGNLPKADCYIMSQILHDWNDERVNVILGHVYEALPKGGALILLEKILDADEKGPEICLLLDMLMLLYGLCGKERTEDEYRKLLSAAGFKLEKTEVSEPYSAMDLLIAKKL